MSRNELCRQSIVDTAGCRLRHVREDLKKLLLPLWDPKIDLEITEISGESASHSGNKGQVGSKPGEPAQNWCLST